jgi:hypothetical protein
MKRFVVTMLAAVAVCTAVGLASKHVVPEAEAAETYKASLASLDAGLVLVGNFAPAGSKGTFAIQCSQPSCYRTAATAAVAADCTTDFVLPTALAPGQSHVSSYQKQFEAGGTGWVSAAALDGGATACKVYSVLYDKK